MWYTIYAADVDFERVVNLVLFTVADGYGFLIETLMYTRYTKRLFSSGGVLSMINKIEVSHLSKIRLCSFL